MDGSFWMGPLWFAWDVDEPRPRWATWTSRSTAGWPLWGVTMGSLSLAVGYMER